MARITTEYGESQMIIDEQVAETEGLPTFLAAQTDPEVSIVMPCLNEAETLGICIWKAQKAFYEAGIAGEVIVADNGSGDGSQEIASSAGAKVIQVEEKGYGSALMGGIAAARGKYVIMGDADDSYDFSSIAPFIERLRAGYDLVIGNRFEGGIEPGAMPPLHRYLGNPVLTGIGRLFFGSSCGDFHCGLRGFSRDAVQWLDLRTTGMEFASEMIVKATLYGMKIAEVPVRLHPDGRNRPPHLRSWRDGWRHLRFLLLYSPRWLFLYPGLMLAITGLGVGAWLMPGQRSVGSLTLDVHTLLYCALAVVIGIQAIIFAVFTKVFAITEGLLPDDPRVNRAFKFFTLEAGLVIGASLMLVGIVATILALGIWGAESFGPLDPSRVMRATIPAVTSMTLGSQIILSSFFLSVLRMRRR